MNKYKFKIFVSRSILYIVVFLLIGSTSPSKKKLYDGVSSDHTALNELFEATNGPNWDNNKGWNQGTPSNKWHGVQVDAQGRVVGLNLRANNLSGQLPESIGKLTKLRYLNVKQNKLVGPLPPTIGQMNSLQFLLLSGRSFDPPYNNDHHPGKQDETTNEFTGTLPATWGKLPNILHIELSHNSLQGNVPSSWGELSSLRGLWLNGNGLSGRLPASLGNLSNLRNLTLSHNDFSGQVPAEWSGMRSLSFLRLNHNQLEGNFPESFSNWRNLQIFYVSKNNFSGPFPAFLVSGSLTKLTTIGLAHNNFSGSLPDFMPLVYANIYVIELDYNSFDGPIPEAITHMPKAIILSFGWNKFSGELPQQGWSRLRQLRFLRVASNELTGAIPSELPDNPQLRWLWFQNNNFTSADPKALGKLGSDKLEEVDISGNHLDYASHIAPAVKLLSGVTFHYGNQVSQ